MKRYYNSTTKEWYTEGNSLTRRVNGALFSGVPSVELLTAWGFVEYIEPEPTPAELLERAKASKIAELEAYDASDAVNGFIIRTAAGDITEWLDPYKRNNAFRAIESAKKLGDSTIIFAIGDVSVTLDVETAEVYLAKVERYAVNCANVTAGHKAAISALESVKAIEDYDYTVGYSTKLVFNM